LENRAGAGGNLAAEAVARATPDGTTLLVATQGIIAINKALFARLSYDPDADFTPIAMLAQQPNLLVVSPRALPDVTTLAGLIAVCEGAAGRHALWLQRRRVLHPPVDGIAARRRRAGIDARALPRQRAAANGHDRRHHPAGLRRSRHLRPAGRPGRAAARHRGDLRHALPRDAGGAGGGRDAARFRCQPVVRHLRASPGWTSRCLAALEAAFRRVLESPAWATLLEQRQADAMPQGRVALGAGDGAGTHAVARGGGPVRRTRGLSFFGIIDSAFGGPTGAASGKARLLLLDSLGCALAGLAHPRVEAFARAMQVGFPGDVAVAGARLAPAAARRGARHRHLLGRGQ
jgi:hypothetical protein